MPIAMRTVPTEARSRPVVQTGRPLICLLAGDELGSNTAALRVQRLQPLGITGQRAHLIAGLAWGEVAHA